MIKPNEISSKSFSRTIGKGYRVDEVDEFLQQISKEVENYITENETLRHKLEILADKLSEYKEDEESLRTALLGAQKLGDSVIRESKTRAEIIIRDANIKADTIISEAKRQIELEQETFTQLQYKVSEFKANLKDLYISHMTTIDKIPSIAISPTEVVQEVEENYINSLEQAEEDKIENEVNSDENLQQNNEEVDQIETNENESSSQPDNEDYNPENDDLLNLFKDHDNDEIIFNDSDDDLKGFNFSSKFGDLKFGDDFRD